jgi:hypothetical protein
MNKQIVLLVVIFAFALIVSLLYVQNQQQTKTATLPSLSQQKEAVIPRTILVPTNYPLPQQKPTITTQGLVPLLMPDKVLVYKTLSQPFAEKDSKSIAQLFSLTPSPTIITSPRGSYFTWGDTKSFSLSIHSQNRSLYFQNFIVKEGEQLNEDAIKQKSLSLSQKLLTEPKVSIGESTITYLKNQPPTSYPVLSKNDANAVMVSCEYLLDGKPLYLVPILSPPISFIGKGADVTSGSISFPPQILSQRFVSTISPETAIQHLLDGKGSLVRSDEEFLGETSIEVLITNAVVSTMKLIYLYNKASEAILPVYLFTGIGRGGASQTKVSILVSATN